MYGELSCSGKSDPRADEDDLVIHKAGELVTYLVVIIGAGLAEGSR